MSHVFHLFGSLLLLASWATIYLIRSAGFLPAFGFLKLDSTQNTTPIPLDSPIDGLWYAPNPTQVNELETVINGSGVYGFIFNSSYAPRRNSYYGGYNYCNMPHVNRQGYVKAPENYTLEYIEVVCCLWNSLISWTLASLIAGVNGFEPLLNRPYISDPQTSQTHSIRG